MLCSPSSEPGYGAALVQRAHGWWVGGGLLCNLNIEDLLYARSFTCSVSFKLHTCQDTCQVAIITPFCW